LKVELSQDAVTIDIGVEVTGQRVSEKQKAAPLTVESMDLLAIKETASDNFYDGLGAMKGVDLTAASLGFKVINTRGFNSTSPVRSLQLIDGVDNQAPGLNFSLGNFLGASDLDVLKVDLIVGASSAFYGPNAFNGVIAMTTKDPFFQKGLSASVKGGERNMLNTAVRWADALKNKKGEEFFGYKLNISYLRADDWVADNYDPVFDTNTGIGNPGRFDRVNTYGDEFQSNMDLQTDLSTFSENAGLGQFHRTGYDEIDLVNYNTRNLKTNLALHFRTDPSEGLESPEIIAAAGYSNGTTVYQGDNRFSLRGISFFQGRLEYRKRDKFFIRSYYTVDDAGQSYDPYLTALRLQRRSKSNEAWGRDYVNFWRSNIRPQMNELGYPTSTVTYDPSTGGTTVEFDRAAAEAWIDQFQDSLTIWHLQAEAAANQASSGGNASVDFFEPGTERFQQEFDRLTSAKNNIEENGTRFFDRSALYHINGEYTFNPEFAENIRVGASARLYTPRSDGTIFYDTLSRSIVELADGSLDTTFTRNPITNFEFGVYGGIEKRFLDEKLTASATLRTDKNENFDWLVSPAASLVWKPKPNNYLRVSFSSAIRNPTLSDQFLFLDVGPATLSGNLEGVRDLVTVESFEDFSDVLDRSLLDSFDIAPVRPESVRTIEAGYRTTLFNSLFVDASYYFSSYTNFLGFNFGVDLEFQDGVNLPSRIDVFRYAANSTNTVNTQGFSIGLNYYFADYFQISGNYSWNNLVKTAEDDPIIPAFNTPEHKFNLGLSGRNIQTRSLKNFGFNINYKWIEGFQFEGSPQFTGFVPTYALLDGQINIFVERINTTFKLGASNILNQDTFQAYGGPRIGRLAYLSVLYEFKKK
ncbi:MAG: TonB-dependent receptor, partial [Bacteroidota bacterium]